MYSIINSNIDWFVVGSKIVLISRLKSSFFAVLRCKKDFSDFSDVIKPLQNKKGQKNLGYPRKKQFANYSLHFLSKYTTYLVETQAHTNKVIISTS